MPLTRRQWLAGATAAAVFTARKSAAWQTTARRVAVHPDIEVGVIQPALHGHFAEHLGSCTYGGLWVGRDSPIPNIGGFRKQAVEDLRAVGIPVLRWPGGCFADDYHWRDGIGPAARRPKRVNLWWGKYVEDNSFGTHEFLALCRLIGAEPYLAGNLGSGTPAELRDWMEYCNHPAESTLAGERQANGAPEPFNVRYWGVGNENWGCGGFLTAEEYAALYRRFATYLGGFGTVKPYLIACGPSSNDLDWTRRFFAAMTATRLTSHVMPHGYAMHFYSSGKALAALHTVETMQEQLSSFTRMEEAIRQQRALLDTYDPQRKIGLLVDEWGVWDRMDPEDEKRYGRLWQPITMRGAVAAALGLNVFHRQADKLVMCNIAQIVNVLHALLLTDGARCVRTPAYHAFELLKVHRGRTAVRTETPGDGPLGLSVSASRKDQELAVSCVNPRHDTALRVELVFSAAQAAAASARILQDSDFNAGNTFAQSDRIVPRAHPVRVRAGRVEIELPPLAVLTAAVRLA